MTGKIPRKDRERSSYINYLKKAEEFIETMDDCIIKENYDSAALNGIHAVISLIDALLIFNHGVVSASQNHEDAIRLLVELIKTPDIKEKAKHALAFIRQKTVIEYWDTLTTRNQAIDISKHVNRFYSWVKSRLPSG